ncbi:BQ2448_4952 [Microbotryum intermedium]|uniref:BQ2448_4952 protein n=1 Tax=Microbotryum intermedium TaxID=269621 RepID=A0A238FM38_9BASI|nr:BQ2448_4952 [Microbotryum intermedium]
MMSMRCPQIPLALYLIPARPSTCWTCHLKLGSTLGALQSGQLEKKPMSSPRLGRRSCNFTKVSELDSIALEGHAAADTHGHSLIAINEKAEAALRWKLDLHILPVVAIHYLLCARLAGLEADLNMTGTYDYNVFLSSIYMAFVSFSLLSNYLCKIVGPATFIPVLSLLFGLFSLAMAFVQTFRAGVAMRFLLGMAEVGCFPGIAYYLSRWYRKDELGFRLAMYVVCTPLAGAFGGLLASGLLRVPSFGPIHTWRMIFFAEGLLTIVIAAGSFFFLADRPETANWLTAEEKALCAARTKSENVGALVVVDELKSKVFFEGMFNLTSILGGLLFMCDNLIVQGLGFYLPSIVQEIFPGMSTVSHQIRTVPPYLVVVSTAILLPYLSWKTKKRALWMSLTAPVMIVGYALFVVSDDATVRYGACFLIASGCFALVSSCNTWSAINTTSDTARAGAISMTVLGGNLGGLLSTWTYLPQYVPHQLPGNIINLGASCLLLILTLVLWGWQHRQNTLRNRGHMDHILDGKSPEEIAMLGTRHPAFRYRQ